MAIALRAHKLQLNDFTANIMGYNPASWLRAMAVHQPWALMKSKWFGHKRQAQGEKIPRNHGHLWMCRRNRDAVQRRYYLYYETINGCAIIDP